MRDGFISRSIDKSPIHFWNVWYVKARDNTDQSTKQQVERSSFLKSKNSIITYKNSSNVTTQSSWEYFLVHVF